MIITTNYIQNSVAGTGRSSLIFTQRRFLFPFSFFCFLLLLLLFPVFCLRAQTYVSAPMTGTPAPGAYYSNSSIVLSNGFSFTASGTNSLTLYITNPDCTTLNTMPSKSQNYIMESVPRTSGITSASGLTGRSTCDLMQTVQYLDGLGRPLQTVEVKGSPGLNDVVQPIVYDNFGRQPVKYLPYTVNSATPGAYQPSAITAQASFYTSPNSTSGVSPISTPQAGTSFEPSAFNRVLEQGAPGDPWQLTGTTTPSGATPGHTVKMIYANNDGVAYWANDYSVTITNGNRSLVFLGAYGANQLHVTVSQDENWTATQSNTHVNTTEEYKDKDGRIVLKRTYNLAGTTLQTLSTYYVYDDLGNLCYVLPPASGADGSNGITSASNQNALNNLCYQYGYDYRNRLYYKQLPGKGPEYMVYNQLDQVVFHQDAVEAGKQQWEYTKYDGLGRVIMTGIENQASNYSAYAGLQSYVTNMITLVDTVGQWEKPTPGSGEQGYTDTAFPWGPDAVPLVVNYYDDYTFQGAPSTFTTPSGATVMTRGLPTASKTTVLNTIVTAPSAPDRLWTVHYYDHLQRDTVTYVQHYLGGIVSSYNYDIALTTYNFTNVPTTVTRKHYNTASTTAPLLTVANRYIYDHMGRKLKTWEQITNGTSMPTTRTLLSQITYNEIGQVQNKQLHSTDSVSFLQGVTYTYNERGWMLSSSAPLFEEQLQYNNSVISGISPTAQYNGNIASQSWGTATAPNANSYVYLYDPLNRLISGTCTTTGNTENNITYDLMGNISQLYRYTAGTLTDQLTYNYLISGNPSNQLQTITDATSSITGVKPGTSAYTFDANGNTLTDQTRSSGNISIAYNMLNLPQAITGAKTITYTYDAGGQKLRRVSAVTGSTDYIGGIEYDGGAFAFIQTEEGRAVPNGTSYVYDYYMADHLGNTRVTFDSHTTSATQIQKDDYYPFGMDINSVANTPPNNYLYNKKELQGELNEYDYGARFYDPVIARWTSIDELAEKYPALSPFIYVADNPIKNIDPDGRKIIFAAGTSAEFKKEFAQAVKFMNAHHTSGNLASLQKSSKVYTIAETKNPYNDDYQSGSRTINWDPNQALETTNGHSLSPATILGHEADHANQDDKHHDQFVKDANTPDAQYTDKEEKRVITGSEQTTAKAHGDIGTGEVTRTDHKGKFDLIPVSNPGSNGEFKIIAHKKKNDKN